MQRIWAILIKEFHQMKRDKATLFMLILMPLMQLIIFGYAINTDVKHVPTVIYDQSRSEESRELISAFVGTSYYDVVEYVDSNQAMLDSIYSGKAVAALTFPPTFSEDIKHGRTAEMQLIVDASHQHGTTLRSTTLPKHYFTTTVSDRTIRTVGQCH